LAPGNEEVTFQKFSDVVHPEDFNGMMASLQEAVRNHTRYSYDYRVIWPDSMIRWIHVEGEITYNGDEPVLIQGVVHDITDRKRAEDKIIASQNELEELLFNLIDTVYKTDEKGILTYLSPSAEQLLGCKPVEAIGRPITDYYWDASERERFLHEIRGGRRENQRLSVGYET